MKIQIPAPKKIPTAPSTRTMQPTLQPPLSRSPAAQRASVAGPQPTSQSSCLSSIALEGGDYADGEANMTIVEVTTCFADPSFGLFSSLGLKAPMLSFSHQERFLQGPVDEHILILR